MRCTFLLLVGFAPIRPSRNQESWPSPTHGYTINLGACRRSQICASLLWACLLRAFRWTQQQLGKINTAKNEYPCALLDAALTVLLTQHIGPPCILDDSRRPRGGSLWQLCLSPEPIWESVQRSPRQPPPDSREQSIFLQTLSKVKCEMVPSVTSVAGKPVKPMNDPIHPHAFDYSVFHAFFRKGFKFQPKLKTSQTYFSLNARKPGSTMNTETETNENQPKSGPE